MGAPQLKRLILAAAMLDQPFGEMEDRMAGCLFGALRFINAPARLGMLVETLAELIRSPARMWQLRTGAAVFCIYPLSRSVGLEERWAEQVVRVDLRK